MYNETPFLHPDIEQSYWDDILNEMDKETTMTFDEEELDEIPETPDWPDFQEDYDF